MRDDPEARQSENPFQRQPVRPNWEHLAAEAEQLHEGTELTATEFRHLVAREYGLDGTSPSERLMQLKQLDIDQLARMIDAVNRSLQGSPESLVNYDSVVRIGETETIRPEQRYDLFVRVFDAIRSTPDTASPERVADVLALTVVLLHPFRDGNGRTARALGLLFREDYDTESYPADYQIVTEPRDRARERGGFQVYGYTPWFPKGFDQSDPDRVGDYLLALLKDEGHGAYISCFGQAPLNRHG